MSGNQESTREMSDLEPVSSREPPGSGPTILEISLFSASVALLLYSCWLQRWIHLDDAFITFRYAENLAAGNGAVFNAGEFVEGYSNPLYMFAMAGVSTLGLDLLSVSRTLGVLSSIAILVVLERSLRTAGATGWGAVLTTLLLSSCFVFHMSTVGGMETLPHAMLLFAGLVLLGVPAPTRTTTFAASGVLILAALTRPEGIAVWGLGGALVLATDRRHAAVYILPFSLYLAHWLWRWGYYGDWLPNTYYVKVGGGSASIQAGLRELGDFVRTPAHAAWIGLAIVGALVGATVRGLRRWTLVMTVAVVSHLAYVVSVGGDSLGIKRFHVPVLGPLAFLAGLVFIETLDRPRWLARARVGLALLLLFAVGHGVFHLASGRFPIPDIGYVEGNRKLGEYLAKTRDPSTLIAVSAAGAIPYYSGLPALDLYGLNDLHISRQPFAKSAAYTGHAKWDSEYVLSRKPDLVIVNRGYVKAGQYDDETLRGVLENPVSLARVEMERELFTLLMESREYEPRILYLGDGSRFFVFERRSANP